MQSDEQLMQQYLDGDERAFAALYTRYKPIVTRVVERHVFRKADVEDLVQQAFTRLHAARSNYRVGEPLRPWLCIITVNVCRDYGRRRARRPEASYDMDLLGTSSATSLPGELRQAHAPLAAALESLSAVTRQIFQQHFLAERPLVDIARELGENPSTVRVRMHRGCQLLRASLAESATV
ncbi:MAG: polymerase sigma-70 factor, subfamily [Myxococcaceae bacterium]|nr:polymerase sigma-70 factor, subfamily [Myxococcaceae bacterium]